MKTKLALRVMLSGLLCAGITNAANVATSTDSAITIGVFSSSGPNIFGSPSWTGYGSNAITWLKAGMGSFGDPNSSPTAYAHAASEIQAGDITVSSFNSWRGDADPDAPFGAELGNRLHFGLSIESNLPGVTFQLSSVGYQVTSSDSNALGFSGDFSTANTFTPTRVGFDGTNYLTAGSAVGVNLVGLYYVGVGNAYNAYGAGTDQQKLDNVENYVIQQGGVDVTGTYSVLYNTGTSSGSFTVSDTVTVVPEPASALLGSIGVLALLRRRR